MSEISSDYSFYRFPKQKIIKPVISKDKFPIKSEGKGDVIEVNKHPVQSKAGVDKKNIIKVENIQDQWKTGNYSKSDGFIVKPYTSMTDIKRFYHEPNLSLPLPLFVPTNKMVSNNTEGDIEKQWEDYLKATNRI
jgi:hypothetical protein